MAWRLELEMRLFLTIHPSGALRCTGLGYVHTAVNISLDLLPLMPLSILMTFNLDWRAALIGEPNDSGLPKSIADAFRKRGGHDREMNGQAGC